MLKRKICLHSKNNCIPFVFFFIASTIIVLLAVLMVDYSQKTVAGKIYASGVTQESVHTPAGNAETNQLLNLWIILKSEETRSFILIIFLLLFLNFLSFGTLAGFWTRASMTEIYVRSLAGGRKASIFFALWTAFALLTILAMLLGGSIGVLMGIIIGASWNSGVWIGGFICLSQWMLLTMFITVFLIKAIRLNPAQIGRIR